MAESGYLPSKDGDLIPWAENFIAVANANLVALGFTAPQITALTAKKTTYSTNLNTAIAKRADAKAATEAKDVAKDTLQSDIRSLARQVQANPNVTPVLKEQLGLNVPDPTPTPVGPFQPTETSIETIGTNLNRLRWVRNGNPQGIIFLIESAGLMEGPWQIIGTTTKASFDTNHRNPLGSTYFRVKAQRGDEVSEAGNVVVI